MSHPLRLAGIAGISLLLAACSNTIPQTGTGAASVTTAEAGGGAAAADGSCGAEERQVLVGQRVDVLNDAELPDNMRVLFPGSAVTQDYDPSRMNISIGENDSITRIYCG